MAIVPALLTLVMGYICAGKAWIGKIKEYHSMLAFGLGLYDVRISYGLQANVLYARPIGVCSIDQ